MDQQEECWQADEEDYEGAMMGTWAVVWTDKASFRTVTVGDLCQINVRHCQDGDWKGYLVLDVCGTQEQAGARLQEIRRELREMMDGRSEEEQKRLREKWVEMRG